MSCNSLSSILPVNFIFFINMQMYRGSVLIIILNAYPINFFPPCNLKTRKRKLKVLIKSLNFTIM